MHNFKTSIENNSNVGEHDCSIKQKSKSENYRLDKIRIPLEQSNDERKAKEINFIDE